MSNSIKETNLGCILKEEQYREIVDKMLYLSPSLLTRLINTYKLYPVKLLNKWIYIETETSMRFQCIKFVDEKYFKEFEGIFAECRIWLYKSADKYVLTAGMSINSSCRFLTKCAEITSNNKQYLLDKLSETMAYFTGKDVIVGDTLISELKTLGYNN